MIKKFKKHLPDIAKLEEYRALRLFGKLLHHPNLWHLHRRSIARAFAIGLFCAWIPVPFQMVLAAGGAIIFHGNLPVSVVLVWITNPLTMPPLFYFSYKVGAMIMALPPRKPFETFELSFDWMITQLQAIWQPFLLGCLVCGVITSILSYITIRALWRFMVIKNWRKRQHRTDKRA